MDGGKIATETFPVEACDHSEVRCFRQIQRITDRYDRARQFQFLGFTNWQGRRRLVHFQNGSPAADVCYELARWIFLTPEFDCEITGFASDRVCRVKCSRRINKKSGATNLAVLVYAVNLNHRSGGLLEKLPDLMADRCGGLVLGKKKARAKTENKRERDERAAL